MRDAKCQYYIVRTIEKHVKTHIVTCTTAKEMYDTLKQIYQRDTSSMSRKTNEKPTNMSLQ
jgi:hypothetical protein